MLPLFAPAGESEGDIADEPANRLGTRQYYRADSIAPSPELHFSIQSFIDALRAEEAASQQNQSQRQIAQQATQYNLDADNATLNRAFEALFADSINPAIFPIVPVVVEVPPPVIHPVEPGPEPDEPPSAPEAIADSTPAGSESSSQSSPTTALPTVSEPVVPAIPAPIEIPPPMIHPVEPGPEPDEPAVDGETASEVPAAPVVQPQVVEVPPAGEPVVEAPAQPVNEPVAEPVVTDEPPLEEPPQMIQPVIMDPDSEHNQPSPEPTVEQEPAPVEPAAEINEPEPVAAPERIIEAEPPVEPTTPVVPEPQPEPPTEPESEPAPEPVVEPVAEVEPETPISEAAPNITPPVVDPEPVVVPVVVPPAVVAPPMSTLSTPDQLSAIDVEELLERAARVTASDDAIIAIVDRNGRILGVHVEGGVITAIPDMATRVFAIDGAVAKARTAAFFSNNQAALTSRTVRFISQTTITQREVEANPNSTDESIRGPGFVAPIGVGGHFPPDVPYTPPVDLFAIEHTNRDSLVFASSDGVRQTVTVDAVGNPIAVSGDDLLLDARFGAEFAAGQEIAAPESYGLVSGLLTNAQSRGIATLPGGVPLYKVDPADGISKLVGGIGVFFPGEDGYATHEQGFVAGVGQTTQQRLNAPLVIEAEYTATVVAKNTATIAGLAPVAGVGLPALPGGGRIDLGGITLESFGPHPYKLDSFIALGQSLFTSGATTGSRAQVNPAGDTAIAGEAVPTGWLVNPTAGSNLTAGQVEDIIERGIAEAELVRAAIRLPLGTRTSMVLAVADTDGKVLGLYRMDDATVFSIDVAVAKARNVVYYADPSAVKDVDRVDANGDGTPDVDAGVAFTNRTFRYLAEPRFPTGSEFTVASPFSTLLTPGVNPQTAENMPGVIPDASDFTTVLGYDAFNPGTNFREDVASTGYQNGIVFFPGSTPLYNGTVLVGGFGVSGDGVDQDDVVTYFGAGEFLPGKDSPITRADEVFVRDVRLPYQKFLRNPHG